MIRQKGRGKMKRRGERKNWGVPVCHVAFFGKTIDQSGVRGAVNRPIWSDNRPA